ncbi:unnamed protein product [Adineta ricciae]|uniref:Uncharacterized protein n=1 Tax=Adineta ricciae TaxID=249248 RepID=A0A815RLX1_ADIRI|nr:unnamed protein product [Adineta ricciae]CAF1479337.1 unnamed protein product [Adineta ricciae]
MNLHLPSHIRDPDAPPDHLKGKSRSNWIRNARKEKQNYLYGRQYPAFQVPSSYYRTFHIHRFVSPNTLTFLIDHVNRCRRFSIDTESECSTNAIALVQINTVPKTLPGFVILVELNHLPHIDTQLFEQIRVLFKSLFKSNNEVYGWGSLAQELEKALPFRLFSFPLACEYINVQNTFKGWIERNPPPCEDCGSDGMDILHRCQCNWLPHIGTDEVWSIQNAIRYTRRLFLDKSHTRSNWSRLLDPIHSNINPTKLNALLRYATYDTLAVSYFIRPIRENWTYEKFRTTSMEDLLTDTSLETFAAFRDEVSDDDSSPEFMEDSHHRERIPSELNHFQETEIIAADDILVNEINSQMEGVDDHNLVIDEVEEIDDHVVIVDEVEKPPMEHRRIKNSRSVESKKRKNKKRNIGLRKLRYKHIIVRQYYYKFTSKMMRRVLNYYGVQIRHFKFKDDQVIIGLKNKEDRNRYERSLPSYCFDMKNYRRFK